MNWTGFDKELEDLIYELYRPHGHHLNAGERKWKECFFCKLDKRKSEEFWNGIIKKEDDNVKSVG